MIARLFCGICLVLLLSPHAGAAPRWVRISVTAEPAHAMNVAWNTDAAAPAQVEYGPDDAYGHVQVGTSEDSGTLELGVFHRATLTGLSPGTTNHYRVGGPGDWSEDHVFTTGPGDRCQPVTFGVASDDRGDIGGVSPCWGEVLAAISDLGVDFIINSGDLVYSGRVPAQWRDFLEMSTITTDRIPLIPSLGNHDTDLVQGDGAWFNRIFDLPRNPVTGTEDFYSFDYGDVHFVALSTETYKDGAFRYQRQRDWLIADLAATDRLWKIVYFHRPVYSSGGHGSNEDGQAPVFVPIFDLFHVDLVLSGHDHIYERYLPLRAGEIVKYYGVGTCYVVSGGGGAITDPIYEARPKEKGFAVGDSRHHFLQVSISGNVLHVRAERIAAGACALQGGTGIIDEFDLIKPLISDPCNAGPDRDGDGFHVPVDCRDTDPGIHPGATEICGDGIDQNCDGFDTPCPCDDLDRDGYPALSCGGIDCNDNDPAVSPGRREVCEDGIDNDCDAATDEPGCFLCTDADGDGYPASSDRCPGGTDCDDGNPEINQGANERCNGADDDCDGLTDEDQGIIQCGRGACRTSAPRCQDGRENTTCVPLPAPETFERTCDDELDNDCDDFIDQADPDCRAKPCDGGDCREVAAGGGCACGSRAAGGASLVLLLLVLVLVRRR